MASQTFLVWVSSPLSSFSVSPKIFLPTPHPAIIHPPALSISTSTAHPLQGVPILHSLPHGLFPFLASVVIPGYVLRPKDSELGFTYKRAHGVFVFRGLNYPMKLTFSSLHLFLMLFSPWFMSAYQWLAEGSWLSVWIQHNNHNYTFYHVIIVILAGIKIFSRDTHVLPFGQ